MIGKLLPPLIIFLFSIVALVNAQRLPSVGSDFDTWGTVLNEFLNVTLDETGFLRNNTVNASHILNSIITNSKLAVGAFSAITGIGIQTQNLNLGDYSIFNISGVNATNLNATGTINGTRIFENGIRILANSSLIHAFNASYITNTFNSSYDIQLGKNTTAEVRTAVNASILHAFNSSYVTNTFNNSYDSQLSKNTTAEVRSAVNTSILHAFNSSYVTNTFNSSYDAQLGKNTTAEVRTAVNSSILHAFNSSYLTSSYNASYDIQLGKNTTAEVKTAINNSGNYVVNLTDANVTNLRNSTGDIEWIRPANIYDVDDEDIESDLNTYVDIAGDTMTGTLNGIAAAFTSYLSGIIGWGNITGYNLNVGWIGALDAGNVTNIKTFNSTYDAKPSNTFNSTYDAKPSNTFNSTYDEKVSFISTNIVFSNQSSVFTNNANLSAIFRINATELNATQINTTWIQANRFFGTLAWQSLDQFPAGCTSQFITALGLIPTCASVTNAFLTSGVFSAITGIGTQTQNLLMGAFSVLNADWGNFTRVNATRVNTTFLNATQINTTWIQSNRYFGSISCSSIDGGSDSDYCVDATGGGGGGAVPNSSYIMNNNTQTVFINASYPQTMNVSNFTSGYWVNGTKLNASISVNTTEISVGNLISCNTIDTDARGAMRCGTDATGAGGRVTPNLVAAIFEAQTKTNIGTSDVDIYTDAGEVNFPIEVNFTQYAQFKANIFISIIGTGTHTCSLKNADNNAQELRRSSSLATGRNTIDWSAIPSWATGNRSIEPRCNSTVALDDPVFLGWQMWLR